MLQGYLQCRKTDSFSKGRIKMLFLGPQSASFGKKMRKFMEEFIF